MAEAELKAIQGRLSGQCFSIPEGMSVTLGRSPQCDIQLPDTEVSRTHCKIANQNDSVVVTDLNSSNGTYLNNEKIHDQALASKDVIRLGNTAFEVELIDSAGSHHARSGKAAHTTIALIRPESEQDADDQHADALRRTFDPTALDLGKEHGSEDIRTLRQQLQTICQLGSVIYSGVPLQTILNTCADAALRISGAERAAVILLNEDNEPMPEATRVSRSDLKTKQMRLSRTIIHEALSKGVSVLTSDAGSDDRFSAGESIQQLNLCSIMCVPMQCQNTTIGAVYVDSSDLSRRFNEQDLALLAAVGHQTGVAIERARLVEDLEHLFVCSMHAIVASLEAKDAYTRGHSERVTAFSLMTAQAMGLDDEMQTIIEIAGLLHDVGKIGVNEAVLCKPGKLTDEEYRIIQQHPVVGATIVQTMPDLDRIVSMSQITKAVRHHHERWDGGGYPDKIAGESIPLAARILAAADTFDAISGDRVYRKGRGPEEAMRILGEVAGSQLDPAVVTAMQSLFSSGALLHPETVDGRFQIHQRINDAEEVIATMEDGCA